jgi:erythromycin esterase-like protein
MTLNRLCAACLAVLLVIPGCGGAGKSQTPLGGAAETQGAPAAAAGAAAVLARTARPVTGGDDDYREILAASADTRRVLLGESTHGTHEYYRERARISEMLIRRHGFNAVAVEGDWTPIARLNDYVRGLGNDRSAAQAMGELTRFPQWMWRNAEFAAFVERLRALNQERPAAGRVGLYGMDVYDMFDAADAVIAYLARTDRAGVGQAQKAYHCFGRYRRSTQAYGEATRRGASCRRQAEDVEALVRKLPRPAEPVAAEQHFAAVRSAASVTAAETYFRAAYAGSLAWNVRDRAMAATVEEIAAHQAALSARPGKVVMWSHNSHTGDARATYAARRGELNIGQLMRERHGEAAFLIGFFSHGGKVMAAPEWNAAGRVYEMKPALAGSHEALFRELGFTAFSLPIRGNAEAMRGLKEPMLQRAIGVIYQPQSERMSHYFDARMAEQFDAAIYFDRSTAVTPLPPR